MNRPFHLRSRYLSDVLLPEGHLKSKYSLNANSKHDKASYILDSFASGKINDVDYLIKDTGDINKRS